MNFPRVTSLIKLINNTDVDEETTKKSISDRELAEGNTDKTIVLRV